MDNQITRPALLEVRDLTVGFDQTPVVKNLTFDVRKGEMLALVGESGCGKSLSGSAIMNLLPSSARVMGGQVMLDGVDLAGLNKKQMRDVRGKRVSLIMQEPMTSLNPVVRIGVQIAEVLERHENLSRRAALARAVELMQLVGIPDAARRAEFYPHHFSGGMRQRVMIAIAVACTPELLIADEPTTALDVSIQAQILALLDRLRKELSMSVLLITHDLGVVAQWAERVIVMYAGRLVEEAPVTTFFESPKHPYSSGLLGSLVGHSSEDHYKNHPLNEIPGSVASAALEPGCPFVPRCFRKVDACRDKFPDTTWFSSSQRVACIKPVNC